MMPALLGCSAASHASDLHGMSAMAKNEEHPLADDWAKERGGRIDPMKYPEGPANDDDRIDEAIAESFPASDPPSWNGGVSG
jgi:hypothetical protein